MQRDDGVEDVQQAPDLLRLALRRSVFRQAIDQSAVGGREMRDLLVHPRHRPYRVASAKTLGEFGIYRLLFGALMWQQQRRHRLADRPQLGDWLGGGVHSFGSTAHPVE